MSPRWPSRRSRCSACTERAVPPPHPDLIGRLDGRLRGPAYSGSLTATGPKDTCDRRQVLARPRDRTRRHRGRSGSAATRSWATGRAQADRPAARRGPHRPRARRARGPAERPAQPPARGRGLRRRGRPRHRRPLAGDGVRRRRHARPAGPRQGALSPDDAGAAAVAGGRRPGRRRTRPDRAPGREAVEHPGRPQRAGEAHRLRHRPDLHRPGPDPDRHGDRVPGVPRPGDRDRRPRRRGRRRVVAGGHHCSTCWPAARRTRSATTCSARSTASSTRSRHGSTRPAGWRRCSRARWSRTRDGAGRWCRSATSSATRRPVPAPSTDPEPETVGTAPGLVAAPPPVVPAPPPAPAARRRRRPPRALLLALALVVVLVAAVAVRRVRRCRPCLEAGRPDQAASEQDPGAGQADRAGHGDLHPRLRRRRGDDPACPGRC